jgi:hypothetical protein
VLGRRIREEMDDETGRRGRRLRDLEPELDDLAARAGGRSGVVHRRGGGPDEAIDDGHEVTTPPAHRSRPAARPAS